MVVLEARGLSPVLAGKSRTCPSTWMEGTLSSALRPGTPYDSFHLPRALREGPACAEPEEVEEEKDICQEGHGHPLLQQDRHLPCAFQPDPGGLPGGGGGWNLAQGQTDVYLSPPPTAPLPASTQSVALVLAVWTWGPQFQAKPVSKVLLGARASGQPPQHWADMLAHARRPSTACSRPGRWTRPWPCSPTCACPCLAPESSPGPRSPWAGPRAPCRLPWGPTIINAFSPMAVRPSRAPWTQQGQGLHRHRQGQGEGLLSRLSQALRALTHA